jgi:hypothetical protein
LHKLALVTRTQPEEPRPALLVQLAVLPVLFLVFARAVLLVIPSSPVSVLSATIYLSPLMGQVSRRRWHVEECENLSDAQEEDHADGNDCDVDLEGGNDLHWGRGGQRENRKCVAAHGNYVSRFSLGRMNRFSTAVIGCC